MPTLTFRKLIKFGASGFVLTIPQAWARYYGLKAGDTMEVTTNGELVVRPKDISSKQWHQAGSQMTSTEG